MSCEDYEDDALWLGKGQERVTSLTCKEPVPRAVTRGGAGLWRFVASVRRVMHDTYEHPRSVRHLLRQLRFPRTLGRDDS